MDILPSRTDFKIIFTFLKQLFDFLMLESRKHIDFDFRKLPLSTNGTGTEAKN